MRDMGEQMQRNYICTYVSMCVCVCVNFRAVINMYIRMWPSSGTTG